LSQPTIPEEGPEHEECPVSLPVTAPPPPPQQSITNKFFASFSSRGDRTSQQGYPSGKGYTELGAKSKDSPPQSSNQGSKLKKSGSFRGQEEVISKKEISNKDKKDSEENGKAKDESSKTKTGSSSGDHTVKSPKLSRTESMTERTVSKISKVIRGTSRSESRSKKNRDTSLSPKGTKEVNEKNFVRKEPICVNIKKSSSVKEDKKSAHEKREMFKSHKHTEP